MEKEVPQTALWELSLITERETETPRGTERDRETERQRDRERDRERVLIMLLLDGGL